MNGKVISHRTICWLAVTLILLAGAPVASGQNVSWLTYGNDLGNTRFQGVDQINPTNVANLKVAWVFHTGVLDDKAELEVSPIVDADKNVMFVVDGHSNVFALNATTGQQIWAYQPTTIPGEMPALSDINVCCGRVSRGLGYSRQTGKVYLARLDGYLVALDAKNGNPIWKTQVVNYRDRFALTMAPAVAQGLVIVGSSGGEYEVRGQVAAFDANTGAEVWRFFTAQAGTWGGNSWATGGATVWQTPAIDSSLGLVYINTSNAAPDVLGVNRIGDNLFSASIVALDIATGHVQWSFQETHHDLWDYDSAQSIVLFTSNGIPALGHCSKNGNYYILDRRNGNPVFSVTETPVPTTPAWQHPSPTQPMSSVEPLTPLTFVPGTIDLNLLTQAFPGVKLGPEWTVPQDTTFVIVPGDDGGCEWNPAAYSPRTKYVYYGTRYEPTTFHTTPNNKKPSNGLFLGSSFDELGPAEGVINFGLYGATDTNTGKVVWRTCVPTPLFAGTPPPACSSGAPTISQPAKSGVLVAGDLVFFGEGNGKFHGVNAATGANLFTYDGPNDPSQHDVGGAHANPVAYVANGKEFIVNAFGGNVPDRHNFPPNPVGDTIIAFSLP